MKFLYRNHKQNNGTKIKILLPAYNQPKIKNDRINKNKELVTKIFLLKLLLKIITTGKVKIVIAIKL